MISECNSESEPGESPSVGETGSQSFWQIAGNDLLVAEFNYIAESAFQANEDRARVSQYFFITFGTFIAAVFSTQLQGTEINQIFLAFSLVFFVNTFLGLLTVLQLARLRIAWREAALAMNLIKDQLTKDVPQMAPYFRWNSSSLPRAFKINSIAFYLAVTVALLSGLAFGAGIGFYSLAEDAYLIHWPIAIGLGSLYALMLVLMYSFMLWRA